MPGLSANRTFSASVFCRPHQVKFVDPSASESRYIVHAIAMNCLDPDTLAAYVDGRLDAIEVVLADQHIDACGSCRGELSAIAAVHTIHPSGTADDAEPTELPARLGRYVVMRELGAGAMGVVVRAYDPELARAVAVKVLRPDRLTPEARDRLRREAQVMAKLAHENIVRVYDVVSDDDRVVVAMELVEGDTLRGYLRERRPWRAKLAACIAAGRGLAAAHAANVVHGDFKPENVLCAGDHIAVSDFGLARPVPAERSGDGDDLASTIAGTPVYMAPELFAGKAATPASDQFSFCVTVYEALYGERPFAGRDRDTIRPAPSLSDPARSLARSKSGSHKDVPVPAWLRKVALRGLSVDPAARYPSMTALVDALADDPSARRWRRVVLASALASAVAIGAIAVLVAREPAQACQIDAGELDGAWDAPRRQVVAAGLAASGSVHAPEMTAKVTSALDAYAETWLATRQSTCEATHVRGEQSEQALDARVACLDRSRGELRELVDLLGSADRTLADHAVEAVYRLRDPATCRGDTSSADPVPADPDSRRVLDGERGSLDRASALLAAGRYKAAAAGAGAVAAIVDGFDVPRLHGEALLARGRAEQAGGDLEHAEATLYEALAAAERGRDDALAAAIWVELVLTTGPSQHRFEVARSDARAADAALSRIEAGPRLKFRYGYTMGIMLLVEGKLDQARDRLERTLAAIEPQRPGDRGLVHSALCNAELQLGHRDRAREHCTQSIELLESTFGPSHPKLATALNTLGALEHAERHWAEARRRFEQVAQMFESNGQVNDLVYALAVSNVGATLVELDKLDDAIPYFSRARELFAAYNPAHPQRVIPLEGLGSIAFRRNDLVTAIKYYEEARALEATYDARDPGRNMTLVNLAVAYRQHGDVDKAKPVLDEVLVHYKDKPAWRIIAHVLDEQASLADDRKDYKAAVALRTRSLAALDHDDDPILRAASESMLGSSLRRQGDPKRALEPLEKAVAYYDQHPGSAFAEALARFDLAQTLWDAGGDHDRALRLARAARDLLATTLGANLASHRRDIDRWLGQRGAGVR